MKNKTQIYLILAAFFIILSSLLLGYYFYQQNKIGAISDFVGCESAGYPIAESYPRQCFLPDGRGFTEVVPPAEEVMCTMEAKQCSDGSYVSRVAPSCDFALCPDEAPEVNIVMPTTKEPFLANKYVLMSLGSLAFGLISLLLYLEKRFHGLAALKKSDKRKVKREKRGG